MNIPVPWSKSSPTAVHPSVTVLLGCEAPMSLRSLILEGGDTSPILPPGVISGMLITMKKPAEVALFNCSALL